MTTRALRELEEELRELAFDADYGLEDGDKLRDLARKLGAQIEIIDLQKTEAA